MDRTINGISVIVCCYNSAKRLQDTLTHLAKQQTIGGTKWELILVNNNSTDTTSELAEQIWESLGAPTSLNIVDEAQPGLSHARQRGMHVAKYNLFLWCDDDNWLCDTYVQTAHDIMKADSSIGALGGWCEAAFESEKPDWFDSQAKYFAVSKQGRKSGDITNKKGCVYGAGMVLRKSHWVELQNQGFKHLLADRVGKKLSSGGDTEYCYALRLLGYKIWFDERLYFKHYMTQERLHLPYVVRIRKAMAYSNFILWPYLDLLQGQRQTQGDFIKKAATGFPKIPIKKTGALILGNFEKKAVAKRYFYHLQYRIFKFDIYEKHYDFILSWSSSKGY